MSGHSTARGNAPKSAGNNVKPDPNKAAQRYQDAVDLAQRGLAWVVKNSNVVPFSPIGLPLKTGAALFGFPRPNPTSMPRRASIRHEPAPQASVRSREIGLQVMAKLDNSPAAKTLAGALTRNAALMPGVARGALHTAEGIGNTLYFGWRLQNPLDPYLSPPGQSAEEQLRRGIGGLIDSGKQAITDPRFVIDGISNGISRANKNLNPLATQQGATLSDEVRRNWNIGLNQGELGFDVASLAYGGGEFQGLSWLARGGRGMTAADFAAKGIPERLTEYFASPYPERAMGHHTIPRRTELPEWMGGGPVPKAILESPFFLLKPKGVTRGEFFERHARVDPKYFGGKAGKEFGGERWSSKQLGWDKYGLAGQLWYGTTPLLKGTIGAGIGLGGGVMGQMEDEEEGQ